MTTSKNQNKFYTKCVLKFFNMKKVIERCGFGDQAYFCILLGFRCCALVKKINILHLFP